MANDRFGEVIETRFDEVDSEFESLGDAKMCLAAAYALIHALPMTMADFIDFICAIGDEDTIRHFAMLKWSLRESPSPNDNWGW